MTYLLDVNALVALGFSGHEFHDRVAGWLSVEPEAQLATCAITELGFVRVLAQAAEYGVTVDQARTWLMRLKRAKGRSFHFIADDLDIAGLPAWVKTARQSTDGHLAELATRSGAVLATFDRKIPGAYLIA